MINEAKEKYLRKIIDALHLNVGTLSESMIQDLIAAGSVAGLWANGYQSDFLVITLIWDLQSKDKATWADILNYAYGTESFQELKAFSPFAGMVYVQITNLAGHITMRGELGERLMEEIKRRSLDNEKLRSTYAFFLPPTLDKAEIQGVGNS